MTSKDRRNSQATVLEKRNSLPSSRNSILSKTLSLSSQNSQKGGDPSIEEIFSSYLGFLQAIYQLQLQRDASFLECQTLSEQDAYRILDINNVAKERWKIVSKVVSSSSFEKTSPLNSPKLRRRLDSLTRSKVERRNSIISESTTETLSELFSRIATEERKQSDLLFEWMYKNEGLKALSDSGYFDNEIETAHCDLDVVEHAENIEINDELRYSKDVYHEDITENPLKPIEELQCVMQRRAGYIATMLQLNALVEDRRRQLSGNSILSTSGGNGKLCQILDDYLTFVKTNNEKLFYSGQDTDKRAREALLLLETQRKEQHMVVNDDVLA